MFLNAGDPTRQRYRPIAKKTHAPSENVRKKKTAQQICAGVLLVSRRCSNRLIFLLVPVALEVCLFAFCLYVKYTQSYILKFCYIYFSFLIRLILPHGSQDPFKCASSPFVS